MTPRVIGSKIVVGSDGRQRSIPIIEQMPTTVTTPNAPLRDRDVSRIWANEEIKMSRFYSEPSLVMINLMPVN